MPRTDGQQNSNQANQSSFEDEEDNSFADEREFLEDQMNRLRNIKRMDDSDESDDDNKTQDTDELISEVRNSLGNAWATISSNRSTVMQMDENTTSQIGKNDSIGEDGKITEKVPGQT